MKKKTNKKKVPAYAFGMDQLNNYLQIANLAGSTMEGVSEEGSGANIAGKTVKGAATGASAGAAFGPIGAGIGAAVGGAGGALMGVFKKKQIERSKRRKRTLAATEASLNNAAVMSQEYWENNSPVYSYENGGILPNLAYVDNNEVIRDNNGNLMQVPNTKPGTDNHLINSSNLDSVLSDNIKNPETKHTFAKDGQKLVKMMKPSKGKDIFANNTNRLNEINANLAYERLLAKQEEVKAKKGIKSKVKGIPAYENGMDFYPESIAQYNDSVPMTKRKFKVPEEFGANSGYMDYYGDIYSPTGIYLGKADNRSNPSYIDNFARVEEAENFQQSVDNMVGIPEQPTFSINPIAIPKDPVYEYLGKTIPETVVKPDYSRQSLQSYTAKLLEKARQRELLNTPKNNISKASAENTGNKTSNIQKDPFVDFPFNGIGYQYNDDGSITPSLDPIVLSKDGNAAVVPSNKGTGTGRNSNSTPTNSPVPNNKEFEYYRGKLLNKKEINTPIKADKEYVKVPTLPDLSGSVKGIDPKKAAAISRATAASLNNDSNKSNNFGSYDWLSLTPAIHNFIQSLRGPEEEPLTLNPYRDAIINQMAKRRMNVDPIKTANARTRAISNYNLYNINANTGANLAARTQSAVDEYAKNESLYATKQNADNAYIGEYANTLNNLGQQFETSVARYNDQNARNRAAARNFGSKAIGQLGKWSQVNKLMNNQKNRDAMILPFLADYLKQGYTADKVNNMYNGYFNV